MNRKRAHPLIKDGSGKRYNICKLCDHKYLNLQLSHVRLLIKQFRVMFKIKDFLKKQLKNVHNK